MILRSQYRAPMLICDETAALGDALAPELAPGFFMLASPSAQRANAPLREVLTRLAQDPRCLGRLDDADTLPATGAAHPTLLAFGGGAIIDRAKCLKSRAADAGVAVRLVSIPTMLGSGAERNDVAVWVDENGVKRNAAADTLRVDAALWCLPLLASLDARQIATGLFDAFMHLFERFFYRGRHSIDAWDGINLDTARQLLRAIDTVDTLPRDTATLLYLVKLTNLANAFDADMHARADWGLHQISHVLSRYYPEAPHAVALASLLPRWLALRLAAGDTVVQRWLCAVLGYPETSTPAALLAALTGIMARLGPCPDLSHIRTPEHWAEFTAEVASMNPSGTVGNYFIIGANELAALCDHDVAHA